MDISVLLDGFVKVTTYMDLFKLLNGFVKVY